MARAIKPWSVLATKVNETGGDLCYTVFAQGAFKYKKLPDKK